MARQVVEEARVMRWSLAVMLMLGGASVLAGAADAQAPASLPKLPAPATVKIGWTAGSISLAGVYVAMERGYFKEANITNEFATVAGMGELVGPLSTGELDLGTGGPSVALFNAVARGIRMKIVADQNTAFPGRSFFALMVRKDLVDSGQIKSFADFKGRRFGMSTRKTTLELDLQKALHSGGLQLSDIHLITMGWPQINAAFATKSLDASFQIEPLVAVASREGLAVRWKGLDEITPNRQNSFLVASEQFVAKTAVIRAWMVAYVRGLRDYNDAVVKNQDREKVVQILMKQSSVRDRAIYDHMVLPGIHPDGEVNVASIREALQAFQAAGDVTADIQLDKIIDLSFVKYAQRVLGPYAR